jgi:hypothetical protein
MLDWGRQKRALDELGEKIQVAVLALGKTQTVGTVRATFSKGRKRYDHEAAWDAFAEPIYEADNDPEAEIEIDGWKQKHERTDYDYRALCKEAGIEDIPFTQGEPSVSLKLTE